MLEACWRHQQACQLPALRSGHVQSCSYSKPDPIMHDITAEVWAALPPGLTSLVTPGVSGFHQSVVASPHPTWQQHSSLHTLRIILYFLYIQKLCLLLAAAPSLADMFEPGRTLLLRTNMTSGVTQELCLLTARVRAGLKFVTKGGSGSVVGACRMCVKVPPPQEHPSVDLCGHYCSHAASP